MLLTSWLPTHSIIGRFMELSRSHAVKYIYHIRIKSAWLATAVVYIVILQYTACSIAYIVRPPHFLYADVIGDVSA